MEVYVDNDQITFVTNEADLHVLPSASHVIITYQAPNFGLPHSIITNTT